MIKVYYFIFSFQYFVIVKIKSSFQSLKYLKIKPNIYDLMVQVLKD